VPGTWSIGWSLKLWVFVVFGKDHRTGELSSSLAPTGEAFFGWPPINGCLDQFLLPQNRRKCEGLSRPRPVTGRSGHLLLV
jgi:hypothetical protein